jgi:phage I-like protein
MKVKYPARVITLNSEAAKGVPAWINLLPLGRLSTFDGREYVVDQAAVDSILTTWAAHGVDMVIDYEHQTHTGDKAPAAGWIKELQAREDGIYGRVEWTEAASNHVAKKEYRYLSPVILIEKKSKRVLAITDMALTNTPRINDFPAIINSIGGSSMEKFLNALRKLLGLDEGAGAEDVTSKIKAMVNSLAELMSGLSELVEIKPDAKPADVVQAVKNSLAASTGQAPIPEPILNSLKLNSGAGESEVLAAIKGLADGSGQAGDLAQEVNALKARLAKRDADDLVEKALNSGKLPPAQKEWFEGLAQKDPKSAEAYLNNATKVIPVGDELPKGKANKPASGADDPVAQMLNTQMGLTAEDVEKFGPPVEQEV